MREYLSTATARRTHAYTRERNHTHGHGHGTIPTGKRPLKSHDGHTHTRTHTNCRFRSVAFGNVLLVTMYVERHHTRSHHIFANSELHLCIHTRTHSHTQSPLIRSDFGVCCVCLGHSRRAWVDDREQSTAAAAAQCSSFTPGDRAARSMRNPDFVIVRVLFIIYIFFVQCDQNQLTRTSETEPNKSRARAPFTRSLDHSIVHREPFLC